MEKPTKAAPQRWLSLLEFAIGALIVIGHNVFHVLPNEVPILFLLGIVSIRLREGSWRVIGLSRPESWGRTMLIAFLTAVIVILMGLLVISPLVHILGLHYGKSAGTSLGLRKGDILSVLKALGITWTLAAFGEEIAYRRYLLGRAAEAAGGSNLAHWLALICVSVLFGFGHYYQGSAGVFRTACDGFVIGAAYLLSRRNLWVAVLAHGFIDSIVFIALFTGLAD
ncbi:MAG TPA: CPBP family intramembrane glutamic endopeptidase [Candidatus Limnocylindrales bacterium]|jgi:membrane protease YdiL (CAAX protease family)|nr:CPBP family intramembrane glutamic endopeptidase [Candidatus Limnocylindrales bacterium]